MNPEPNSPHPTPAAPTIDRFAERMRELASQVDDVATDLQRTQAEVNRQFAELRGVVERIRSEITLQQARTDWQTEMLSVFHALKQQLGGATTFTGSRPLSDTLPDNTNYETETEPNDDVSDLVPGVHQGDTESEMNLPASSGMNLSPLEPEPVRAAFEPSLPPPPEVDTSIRELNSIRNELTWILDTLKKNHAPQTVDIQAARDLVQKEITHLTTALQSGIEPGLRALRLRESAQRLFSGTLLYQDKLIGVYARMTSAGTVEFVSKVRARRDRLWRWIALYEPDYLQLDVRKGHSASKPPPNVPQNRSQNWFESIPEESATDQEYTILEVVSPGYLQRLPNGNGYTLVRPATLKIAIRPH